MYEIIWKEQKEEKQSNQPLPPPEIKPEKNPKSPKNKNKKQTWMFSCFNNVNPIVFHLSNLNLPTDDLIGR